MIDLDDPGTVSAYDELPFWSARFGALLLDNLPIRRGIEILDVGCGTGFPLFELAQLHGATSHVTGIDPWRAAIERAREKLAVYDLPNVTLIEGDAAMMPFEQERFDRITSNLGLNNFADPAAVLRECRRVARDGALFVGTTNVVGHMRELYDAYREALRELGLHARLDRLAAQEEHRGTRESHAALLEGAGFEVARVVESSFTLRYLDGSAMLSHYFIRLGFLDGWRSVVESDEIDAVLASLERKLNELSSRNGVLEMSVPMLYLEAVAR